MRDSDFKSPGYKIVPVKILIPAALTIALFAAAIFMFILPMLENFLMDGKREGILRLTESACSVLEIYHEKEQQGSMTREQAQAEAALILSGLRYGDQRSDYFWINDFRPVMIMHPYRRDLEGEPIGSFEDPSGKKLFLEVVDKVKQSGSGFVDYLWQWKDDPLRIVPKISYVQVFEPWGWIIGTGIYVEDVKAHIHKVTHTLVMGCIGIAAGVVILCIYIIWTGFVEQKARLVAINQSRQKEKQLIQADKISSLGGLVAGVAHELNTPTAALMLNGPSLKKMFQGFIPVLERYYGSNPGARVCNMTYAQARRRTEMMLKGIEDSAGTINGIINDLKDFSRPADPKGIRQEIDINEVVTKSVEMVKPSLEKYTCSLVVECQEHLPKVAGDFNRLQQVVVNLLVNAGQALKHNEQSIFVSTFKGKDGVGIEVRDTGPGVPAKMLDKLTEPFFTTRTDEGGTGLGLSISRKIINEHNGSLTFESESGKGLTARVLLPGKNIY